MIKAIISDSDGTLVNTLYLIRHGQYETAIEYFVEQGLHRDDLPTYTAYEAALNKAVGGPTLDTLQGTLELLKLDFPKLADAVIDFEDLDSRRLTAIQDRLAPLYVHPFPELDDFLKVLDTLQLKLAIYTSGSAHMIVRNFGVSIPSLGYSELYKNNDFGTTEKTAAFIERMKSVYNLPDMAVVTCDDVSAYKPDPEGVLTALARLNVAPDEAVVIGDHAFDMQAAKAAGVYAIGVSHGFDTPEQLKAAGADAVCANLHEVIYHIQYVLNAQ